VPSFDTNELIKNIENAVDDLGDIETTDNTDEQHVHTRALIRMKKSLTLARCVIKGIAANIYKQWNPSPDLPVMEDDFDSTNEKDIEIYMNEVTEFLNNLVGDLATTKSDATDQKSKVIYKLGNGIKNIALHVAPFVKTIVKMGKQDGLVTFYF
jgi:hypothetical protein